MDDKSQIEALYKQMYRAMVEKDTVTLDEQHADEFVLTHMTGMRQPKREYIRAIANGTLNYYEAVHEQMDIRVSGNNATLTGRSRVSAALLFFQGVLAAEDVELVDDAEHAVLVDGVVACVGALQGIDGAADVGLLPQDVVHFKHHGEGAGAEKEYQLVPYTE